MCASVWLESERADGFVEDIETVGHLRKHCGFVYAVAGVQDSDLKDDECLCGVNIPASLIHNGFKVWIDPENVGLSIYSAERVKPCSAPTAT